MLDALLLYAVLAIAVGVIGFFGYAVVSAASRIRQAIIDRDMNNPDDYGC